MLLWFAGFSVVIVWLVFRDPAFDYRLVIVGALVPDLLLWFGHTMIASVALLVVVMVVTQGGSTDARRRRRRWLALPIGAFVHLVLDGAWVHRDTFWWPAFGAAFEGPAVPSLHRSVGLLVVMEIAGAAALVWAWRRRLLGTARV